MDTPDLVRAAALHYSFLPKHYNNDHIDVAIEVKPYKLLGGDYCSIFPIDDHRLVLCLCDVMGHDVAASLLAARINTFVLTQAIAKQCPCHLIESLNSHLCQRIEQSGMTTTFFSVFIDAETETKTYAGAGHPPVIHIPHNNRDIQLLESVTTIVGFDDPMPIGCDVASRTYQPGDKLVLYTDGLIEQQAQNGKWLQINGLIDIVGHYQHLDSKPFNNHIDQAITEKGYQPRDDILVMTATLK
ncbi:MAG: hypothetical protein BMS9Abin15_0898 [Gammaproteobacteria bacterium]|nr:MAG: hypothetical protein BMS9Abin15_0898 [Gammaproteobacteria bacterium]